MNNNMQQAPIKAWIELFLLLKNNTKSEVSKPQIVKYRSVLVFVSEVMNSLFHHQQSIIIHQWSQLLKIINISYYHPSIQK